MNSYIKRLALFIIVVVLLCVGNAFGQGNENHYEALIDSTTFSSKTTFEKAWNYYYPWGREHNGSAKMFGYDENIHLSDGILTITANKINEDEGSSSHYPYLKFNYHSGAIHAKKTILINDQFPYYEVKGKFKVPTVKGSWPAFWLTAVHNWPPESDIMEFKGDSINWQNTFRTPKDVSTIKTGVKEAACWHEYKAILEKMSDTLVTINYYFDGQWKGEHSANFVDAPMWLIINMQMEGSSGDPGPLSDMIMQAKDIYVGRVIKNKY